MVGGSGYRSIANPWATYVGGGGANQRILYATEVVNQNVDVTTARSSIIWSKSNPTMVGRGGKRNVVGLPVGVGNRT